MIEATSDSLMKAVVAWYFRSGDFNGLHLDTDTDSAVVGVAKDLVAAGKLQVMVEQVDY